MPGGRVLIYRVGRHRLVHGDARDPQVIAAACEEIAPTMLVYDPPWGAIEDCPAPAGPWTSTLAFCDARRLSDAIRSVPLPLAWLFAWDCGACWWEPQAPMRRLKLCAWLGDRRDYRHSFRRGAVGHGPPTAARVMRNGRGMFKTHAHDETHFAELYAEPLRVVQRDAGFRYAKPIAWMRALVNNCGGGVGGANVLDPYAGSGTTLLACERTGRQCAAIEHDAAAVTQSLARFRAEGLEVVAC